MTPPETPNPSANEPVLGYRSAVIVDTRPHLGPFYTSVIGAVFPALLLIALACGMPMNMITVLAIVIPGMVIATTLLAIAMGWIFILFGRTKRRPRWIPGLSIMIAITMAELFALTYISSLAQR